MKTLYTASASASSGRDGHVATDDNRLSFDLSRPGQEGSGTNPEQLFACGYAACFGSAVAHVAKQEEVETGKVKVNTEVNLNQGDKGFFLSVTLDVSLPEVDEATAGKLVKTAHTVCPYSKAITGNVDVTLKVNGKPL